MQLLLTRVEAGQNDRDGRTRRMRRPPQIAGQLRAAKRNSDALNRRIGHCRRGLITGQHAPMRRKVLRRIVGKQMFGVVIVNRRAQIGLPSDAVTLRSRFAASAAQSSWRAASSLQMWHQSSQRSIPCTNRCRSLGSTPVAKYRGDMCAKTRSTCGSRAIEVNPSRSDAG